MAKLMLSIAAVLFALGLTMFAAWVSGIVAEKTGIYAIRNRAASYFLYMTIWGFLTLISIIALVRFFSPLFDGL
jgi:hypothetical protein